jgi:hypothetical protein
MLDSPNQGLSNLTTYTIIISCPIPLMIQTDRGAGRERDCKTRLKAQKKTISVAQERMEFRSHTAIATNVLYLR